MKNQVFPPKSPRKCAYNRASGNVLILILIVTALFGALSFAMMQGNRANTGLMGGEQAKLRASEILSYANSLSEGTKKILISNIPLEQISFQMAFMQLDNGTAQPSYLQNAACLTQSCRLFSSQGGGAKEQHFFEDAVKESWWDPNWAKAGSGQIALLDIKDVGTTKPDIVLQIQQMKSEICAAINIMMGLPTTVSAATDAGKTFYHAYAANLNVADATNAGYASPAVAGKKAYCDSDSRTVNVVILAR